MKKVLFYIHFMKIGGIEKVSIEYIQGLIGNGYKVDLLIDYDMGKDGNTFEYMIPKEVNFSYVKSQKISKTIYYFRTLAKKNKLFYMLLYPIVIIADFYFYHKKVKKIVDKEKYDTIISLYQFLPSYITTNKLSKHIIWLHGSVEHFFGGVKNLFKNTYGKKLDKYDRIVTVADEMKQQLASYYPKLSNEKIKRIYNPFDFEDIKTKSVDSSELSLQEKKLITDDYICTVSRLDENQKDIKTLVEAYETLYLENKITHKLYIIGDGADRKFLEQLVFSKGLNSQILFLGKKTNPFIWMKNAKIFILSSKFEGFGLVLVEAMTVETFVVSSGCKVGPTEILEEGDNGDLFEVRNPKELAERISNALLDKEYIKPPAKF